MALPAEPAAGRRARPSVDDAPDAELLRRYHRERRSQDRDALVRRYLPLARHVAARYSGGNEPIEDLEQVASLGLIKAIDRFDPGNGAAFSSYAVPTIAGELRRYFRDHTWSLRVPRDIQEMAVRMTKVEPQLEAELGRAPTAAELCKRLGCSLEVMLEARSAAGANRMASLDAPFGSEEEGGSLADVLGADDAGLAHLERVMALDSAMDCLSDRDRTILTLRFRDELTQAAIGERVGLSQMHVSRLIRQALITLREASAGDGLLDAAA